jgi:hypothetical protein
MGTILIGTFNPQYFILASSIGNSPLSNVHHVQFRIAKSAILCIIFKFSISETPAPLAFRILAGTQTIFNVNRFNFHAHQIAPNVQAPQFALFAHLPFIWMLDHALSVQQNYLVVKPAKIQRNAQSVVLHCRIIIY